MIQWANEYKILKPHYKVIVDKFIEYLKDVGKIDSIGAIKESDIEEFLKYCTEDNRGVNSRKTLESYYEGLKEFYRYLMENKYIQYSIFSGIVHHQDVKQKLSLKLDLREEVSRGFLTLNELEVIVDKVNEYFETVDFQKLDKKQLKENYIMFLIVRVFVKLTMLAPAKRQIICDIRASDFDSDYKMVTINSQKIALPRSFTSEIKETLKFIKNLRDNKEIEYNQRIFDYIYGKFYKDENITVHLATFSSYMDLDYILVDSRMKNNKKYTTSVEPIMNGAICELWRSGQVDVILLSKVCGVTVSTISGKLMEWAKYDEEEENNLLNKAIRRVSYYNLL